MENLKLFLVLFLSMILTACGGGNSNSTPAPNDSTPGVVSYVVRATASEGGVVNSPSSTILTNMTTAFTFTAKDGYFLKSVTGCGGALSNNVFTTAPITTNCNVVGVFELTTFEVSVSASANGTYVLQNAKVIPGQFTKVTAVPDSGYMVESISGCGTGILESNTYITAPVIANCSVSIRFKKAATIEGTAAEGAALANAVIFAKCADGSGFATATKTDESGHYIGQVDETAFPCALKLVSSNQEKTYFSVALEAGTVNITPLTDLALVISSRERGADWYASSGWNDAILQLPAAKKAIQSRLNNMGYILPAEEFEPFTSKFSIGDAWDVLLDQFIAGLGHSETKTYDTLVNLAKAQGTETIPSPAGRAILTAEVCFNPNLYAEGTTYSIKERTETIRNDSGGASYGSELISNYLNGKTVVEHGLPILSQNYTSNLISFVEGSQPATSTYIVRISVDFDGKSITSISSNGFGTFTDLSGRVFTSNTRSDGVGSKISFKTAVGVEVYDTYTSYNTFVVSINGREDSRSDSQNKIEDKRTFKGLANIQHAGKIRKVCEFEVKRKWIHINSPEFETVLSEYYLLGSGLDVSSPSIISIILNGKEI